MAEHQEARFNCGNCGAQYKVVRVEAPTAADREIACLRCAEPLEAREGRFALKYFLVGRAVTPNRRAR